MRFRILIALLSLVVALLPGAAFAHPNQYWDKPGDHLAAQGPVSAQVALATAAPGPAATPAATEPPAGPSPSSSSTARRYTFGPNDTLWGISLHFGLGIDDILRANSLASAADVTPGMELLLPWTNEVGTARMGANGPVVSGPGLHFVVSTSQQTCWLFQDGKAINRWPCSTGRSWSPSALGNYTVQSKLDRGYFAGADSWMPFWLGLYTVGDTENGIHGLPYAADTGEKFWTDKVGTPVTFGCIMLDDLAAQHLWNMAYVGMPVTILP